MALGLSNDTEGERRPRAVHGPRVGARVWRASAAGGRAGGAVRDSAPSGSPGPGCCSESGSFLGTRGLGWDAGRRPGPGAARLQPLTRSTGAILPGRRPWQRNRFKLFGGAIPRRSCSKRKKGRWFGGASRNGAAARRCGPEGRRHSVCTQGRAGRAGEVTVESHVGGPGPHSPPGAVTIPSLRRGAALSGDSERTRVGPGSKGGTVPTDAQSRWTGPGALKGGGSSLLETSPAPADLCRRLALL